ncbi:MAG: hypothetical protein CV089_25190, partial [Nitrospira sp. WS110]|nr:hypothetical protein [Nitrospira sp. WS110]
MVRLEIVEADATQFDVDVLAMKYAQAWHGLDASVWERLVEVGHRKDDFSPLPGEYRILDAASSLAAKKLLFVGTEPLWKLGYLEIRVLARTMLSALTESSPNSRTVAVTLHGVNYGLDEGESFQSMIAGFMDAVESGDVSNSLHTIIIVELNRGRVGRLRALLGELVPGGILDGGRSFIDKVSQERLRAAGYASASKSHVFVAMPFSDDFEDVYHYAIHAAVNKVGLLCERVDVTAFTGDIVQRIQERIRSAALLIADLTTANPNEPVEKPLLKRERMRARRANDRGAGGIRVNKRRTVTICADSSDTSVTRR